MPVPDASRTASRAAISAPTRRPKLDRLRFRAPLREEHAGVEDLPSPVPVDTGSGTSHVPSRSLDEGSEHRVDVADHHVGGRGDTGAGQQVQRLKAAHRESGDELGVLELGEHGDAVDRGQVRKRAAGRRRTRRGAGRRAARILAPAPAAHAASVARRRHRICLLPPSRGIVDVGCQGSMRTEAATARRS